ITFQQTLFTKVKLPASTCRYDFPGIFYKINGIVMGAHKAPLLDIRWIQRVLDAFLKPTNIVNILPRRDSRIVDEQERNAHQPKRGIRQPDDQQCGNHWLDNDQPSV